MIYNTHMIIADIVYTNIGSITGFKIKKTSFIYGNVKPDVSTMIVSIPHKFDSSMDYVLNEIVKLIAGISNVQQLKSREFARKLGIITHYISDFFCKAHNKGIMDEGILSHLKYERKLNKYVRVKLNMGKVCYNNDYEAVEDVDIKEYIINKHNYYLEKKSSMNKDISFALEASITVTCFIVGMCMKRCYSIAA